MTPAVIRLATQHTSLASVQTLTTNTWQVVIWAASLPQGQPTLLHLPSKDADPSHHFLAGFAQTLVTVGDGGILCTSTHSSLKHSHEPTA